MKILIKIVLAIFLLFTFLKFIDVSEKVFNRVDLPTIRYYDENLTEHTGRFNMHDKICEALWYYGLEDKVFLPLKYVRQCLLNEGV